MSIQIFKPAPSLEVECYMSEGEASIVKRVKVALGRVEAVRVARAFAKSSLKDAVEFVDKL